MTVLPGSSSAILLNLDPRLLQMDLKFQRLSPVELRLAMPRNLPPGEIRVDLGSLS